MELIRLPDGNELQSFSFGILRTVAGVQYPERDLFKKSVMLKLGIKSVLRVDEDVDQAFYAITGETESEEIVDGIAVVTVTPTIQRKFTVTELAKEIGKVIKRTMRGLYKTYKIYYDELTDDQSPIYDLSDSYVIEFETYRTALKAAFNTIKTDINDIRNSGDSDAVKYQNIIDYDWRAKLPDQPGEGTPPPA